MLITAWKSIKLWDTDDTTVPLTIDDEFMNVSCIVFHPEQCLIYFSNSDNNIYSYGIINKEKKKYEFKYGVITAITISSDGLLLAFGTQQGQLVVFNPNKPISNENLSGHLGHKAKITHVMFSPDNRIVYAGDTNGKVSMASFKSPSILYGWTSKHGHVYHMDFDIDGRKMIIAAGGNVYIQKVSESKEKATQPIMIETKVHEACCVSVCASAPKLLVVGTVSGDLLFYDKDKLKLLVSINLGSKICAVSFRHDGKFLIVSIENDGIYQINVSELSQRTLIEKTPDHSVKSLVFSPNSQKNALRDMIKPLLQSKMTIEAPRQIDTIPQTKSSSIDEPITKPKLKDITVSKSKQAIKAPSSVQVSENKPEEAENTKLQIPTPDQILKPKLKDPSPNQISELKTEEIDTPKIITQTEEKIQNHREVPSKAYLSPLQNHETKREDVEKPKAKLEVINNDYSDDEDVASLTKSETTLLKIISRSINEGFETMGQQINAMHLNLVCRIRSLEERIKELEDSK